jgi:hypothetical protein
VVSTTGSAVIISVTTSDIGPGVSAVSESETENKELNSV